MQNNITISTAAIITTAATTATAVAPITRPEPAGHAPDPALVRRLIEKRSFATLATTSEALRPHTAGVLYEVVDDDLWINTLRSSRKARNLVANPRAAVCIPVRRIPFGPPSTIHFQATAEVLDLDSSAVTDALQRNTLRSLTSHGELDLADGCFLRIALPNRLLTYGLGMSLRKLIADPLGASGSVDLSAGLICLPG